MSTAPELNAKALVDRLLEQAAECDENASSGCNVQYVEPMKAWDDFAAGFREAAEALAALREAPVAVPDLSRPVYCKPHEFLLLASHCGDDTEGCTESRPCTECLAMCNIFGEDGRYLRQLGKPVTPPDASPASHGVVEALTTRINDLITSTYETCEDGYYDTPLTMLLRDIRAALAPSLAEQGVERPSLKTVLSRALSAVAELDDWTNENETSWTGWGEQTIPPMATFWRVKSGQALKALEEFGAAAPEQRVEK